MFALAFPSLLQLQNGIHWKQPTDCCYCNLYIWLPRNYADVIANIRLVPQKYLVWCFNQIKVVTSVQGLLKLSHRIEYKLNKDEAQEMEVVHGGELTSVIIFPLVLFLSRWLALFCFCCSTRSLVVRYSRANSLRILLKRWMLTSRTAYIGWPRNSRKAWNLQMLREARDCKCR